jgi:hypothetical protein
MKASDKATHNAWETAALAAGAVVAALAGYKALQRSSRAKMTGAANEEPFTTQAPSALPDTPALDAVFFSDSAAPMIEEVADLFNANYYHCSGASAPLIWEQGQIPESVSEAWGETVWFGLQDLDQSHPCILEFEEMDVAAKGLVPLVQTLSAFREGILLAEALVPTGLDSQTVADKSASQLLNAESFLAEPNLVYQQAFQPEKPSQLSLLQALAAAPKLGAPAVEDKAQQWNGPASFLEVEPVITSEENETWDSLPFDDFSRPVGPPLNSQPLVKRIFAIESSLSEPLPARKSFDIVPKRIVPNGVTEEYREYQSCSSNFEMVSATNRLTPLAPAEEKLSSSRSRWPLIAAAMAMFLIAGLFAAQMLSEGVFVTKHQVKTLLHMDNKAGVTLSETLSSIGANGQSTVSQ